MRWLKERKYRIWISLAAGLAGIIVMTAVPGDSLLTAWWGTLYPKFCFSETSSGSEVKISFWLAKVLGWC